MMKTRICDLFGIETPIFCAAMGGVALGELAAAVSEAGALARSRRPASAWAA